MTDTNENGYEIESDGRIYTKKPKGISIKNLDANYGCLHIAWFEGETFWCMEDYSGCHWVKIPKSLYRELLKYSEGIAHDEE